MLLSEQIPTPAPVLRVYLFGECVLERLVAGSQEAEQMPRYERVSNEEWKGRGPALALLKLLLCRHHRRAMKDELVAALWPEPEEDEEEKRLKNADRALDAAVSVLRKVLGTADGGSMLATTSSGDGTIYKLPGQECVWVDADAFEQFIQQALRATHPHEAIALWEAAYHLTRRGEFLEEDLYRDWASSRRNVLAGRIGNCVYALTDLYIQQQRPEQAQDLLWQYIEDHPSDEDTLYRLLLLLERQDRLFAGWQLYQQVKEVLKGEGVSPAPRIKGLAKRINSRRMALEARVSERGLTLLYPTVGVAENSGLSVDCATWFAVKQAEIIDLIEQWKGHALHCDELQTLLHPLLNALNERQPGHSQQAHTFSRRQVLLGIAALALPLLFSDRHTEKLSLFAEEFLPGCAAAIMACRNLMKGDDLFQAEPILAHYLLVLESIMKEPSPYQPVAAHLAMQCAIFTGILASHHLAWVANRQHYEHGIQYGQLIQDHSLQTTVRVKLASTFFYLTNPSASPTRALETYQDTFSFVEGSSPLTRSNFYVKLAGSYAQDGCEQEARVNLSHGYSCFPTHPENDPAFLYADFGLSSLILWEGLTLLELARRGHARPREAWDAFAQIDGANPKIKIPEVTERGRAEIINHRAGTAIVMKDLDLFCACLKRGVEGARQLGSDMRLQEAMYYYWQARKMWPHEQRVKDMAELFIPHRPSSEVFA